MILYITCGVEHVDAVFAKAFNKILKKVTGTVTWAILVASHQLGIQKNGGVTVCFMFSKQF